MKLHNRTLEDWIAAARANGAVQNPLTVASAYCLDLPDALRLMADVAAGQITEREALAVVVRRPASAAFDPDCDWCSQVRAYRRPTAP